MGYALEKTRVVLVCGYCICGPTDVYSLCTGYMVIYGYTCIGAVKGPESKVQLEVFSESSRNMVATDSASRNSLTFH